MHSCIREIGDEENQNTANLTSTAAAGLVSVEGSALSAVKPWSSFQCTGIHHAVRARTYNKVDEHLAYSLNKSLVPLPYYPDSYIQLAYATGPT